MKLTQNKKRILVVIVGLLLWETFCRINYPTWVVRPKIFIPKGVSLLKDILVFIGRLLGRFTDLYYYLTWIIPFRAIKDILVEIFKGIIAIVYVFKGMKQYYNTYDKGTQSFHAVMSIFTILITFYIIKKTGLVSYLKQKSQKDKIKVEVNKNAPTLQLSNNQRKKMNKTIN